MASTQLYATRPMSQLEEATQWVSRCSASGALPAAEMSLFLEAALYGPQDRTLSEAALRSFRDLTIAAEQFNRALERARREFRA